ncbi:hypothetical protein B0T17DRAFT_590995 [Bombardia bombarda]|uniref:SET domain-containing protein n=1 Tax=Bombardia bombarda TaxID=252184 RepID=A0AA39X176_9PEZI|nr:hypothetical protein B0T17DRAFT_590995 [Bombardia bombarda]
MLDVWEGRMEGEEDGRLLLLSLSHLPGYSPFGECPLVIDDSTGPHPTDWSPWTHRPKCLYSREISEPDKRFCVFTNSRHGPRGLTIVTTPESAADSIAILNELANVTTRGLSYKIIDIPGKGKGVVATRHISRYEELMVDYAALAVDISFTTLVPARDGYRLLQLATKQLSDPDSVLNLGQSNAFAADVIENVLRTNAFHTILSGAPHMALYPEVSRINHACKPNAYTRFIPQSLGVSVAASRDIKLGEEITISYLTVGETSDVRQRSLRQWGFECSCDLCSSSAAEVAASDARRRQIDMLRHQAVQAFTDGKPYQALRITRQVLNLLPLEGLFPLYSEQYENIARVYWMLRDREKAEKYARISLDVLAEQGYISRVRPGDVEIMWNKFVEGG